VKTILRQYMTNTRNGGQIVSCWNEPLEADHEPLIRVHDVLVKIQPVTDHEMRSAPGETSATVAARVAAARKAQAERQLRLNARLGPHAIRRHCTVDETTQRMFNTLFSCAQDRLGLRTQDSQRILTVARTIADLHGKSRLQPGHLAEAIQYSPRNQLKFRDTP